MNTYIFNGFIIIIIFIIIQLGVFITLINVRNNKDDRDKGIAFGKDIDCQAKWTQITEKNIQDGTSCYDLHISNYVITNDASGEGTKCLFSPSDTISLNSSTDSNDSFKTARNKGSLYVCKTSTPPTPSCKPFSPTTTATNSKFYIWLKGDILTPPSGWSQKIPDC
tara:strand:- start:130 stop:627 length:498 start_codon:yes stop_codon:yes gene_type:complete